MLKRVTAILFGTAALLTTPAYAQWHVGVDFMVPTRHTSTNTIFQRNQSGAVAGNDVRLGEERDLELDLTAGGRITLGNRSGMYGVEGSYLATTDWTETASVFDPAGGLASPFTLPGRPLNPTFESNTSVIVDYTTQMDTADINLSQTVYVGQNGSVFLLLGARYLSIEESLNYASDNAIADHTILTTTDNRLFGPQFGVAIESPLGAGTLNLSFKSALAYNSVDKTTNFDGTLGAGSDESAALMSEIGVDCVFFPTNHLSVRLGWYFLAATDIALATDNFENNPAVLGSGLVNIQSDRGVLYHTPYVGAVFAY
jgi:hypothetical protein